MRRRYPLVAGILAIVFTIALASIASAHASFVSSVPAANSTVKSVPSVVVGTFAEGIVPSSAQFTVVGPNGARADVGDGKVDLTNPARNTMKVTLKSGLGSGKYTVSWATVSADDGDPANGTFVFTVALPAATSPAASAATTPSLPKTGGLPLALPVAAGLALAGVGLGVRRIGR